jgi:predicted membrane protein
MKNYNIDKRLLLGILIIIIGIALLARSFGFFSEELNTYLFRWEMIFIGLGLVFLISRSNPTTGIIFILIGTGFYISNVFNVHFNFWQIFLPSLLILTGILIIFRHSIDHRWQRSNIPDDDNHIDETAVFGGGDRIIRSQHFEGGKVTAFFGGLNYNMLNAKLAPGQNVIDVFCVFGGMTLIVPPDWNVKIRVMSIFGGFNDKHRFKSAVEQTDTTSQLVIKGIVVFGGGEIKRYID